MKGISSTLLTIILLIVGLALAVLFILIYLNKGGVLMNNTTSGIPNVTPLLGQ